MDVKKTDHDRYQDAQRWYISKLESMYEPRDLADKFVYRCFRSATFFYREFPNSQDREKFLSGLEVRLAEAKDLDERIADAVEERLAEGKDLDPREADVLAKMFGPKL